MWIRVEDNLPPFGEKVLACFKGQFNWVIFIAELLDDGKLGNTRYAPPTHWMALPVPPKED